MNTQIFNAFNRFVNVYNLKTKINVFFDNKTKQYSHSFITMDYNAAYGGYVIEIVHSNTSTSHFGSSARKTKAEMLAYLNGLVDAKNAYNFETII